MAAMAPAKEQTGDLLFLLAQASHALTAALTAGLAELGISPRMQCVLSKAMGGDLTQSQLAELTALDKTTMVVTIDELERAGLAERRLSASDRRARIIAVTDAGVRVVAEAERIVSRIYDDLLSALPPEERQGLMDGLNRLVAGPLSRPAHCDRSVRRRSG
jgi:DNA-binding MarR family transcriptional regulator